MSGMVNSYPLNGASLASWVKAATVAASVALTATVDATRIQCGAASLSGGASASATCIRVFPGASTASSQAVGTVYPWYQGAGEAVLVGRATALASCERIINAEAAGTATASGSAIAESEIGEVIAAASFTIEAEATRNRPGRANFYAEVTATPPAVVFGQTVTLSAGSTARAEASTQLSGEAFWRHDGYVEAEASGVLSQQVTWSIQSVPLGMGFTVEPEATRQRPATALLTVTCDGVVEGLSGVPGEVNGSAGATGSAMGTRVHGAQVDGTASVTTRIAVAPSQEHAARASASTALSGLATPNKNTVCLAQAGTTSQVSAGGVRQAWGEASLTASSTASASGGRDHAATVDAAMGATAVPAEFATQWYAEATATADATATPAEHATQHYATATAVSTTLEISAVQARSNLSLAYLYAFGNVTFVGVDVEVGAVTGLAVGAFTTIALATSHKGTVLSAVLAQGVVKGDIIKLATVTASAEATGRAVGLRRGDFNAPPERSMILSYEPRGMIVPEAEHTLWVPA